MKTLAEILKSTAVKTKFRMPWFANRLVEFYEDPTEPTLYPEAFTRYIEVAALSHVIEHYELQILALKEENRVLKEQLENKVKN